MPYNASMRLGRVGICLLLVGAGIGCGRGPGHFVAKDVALPDLVALVPPAIRYEPKAVEATENRLDALFQAVAKPVEITDAQRFALDTVTSDAARMEDPAVLHTLRTYFSEFDSTLASAREAVQRPESSIGEISGDDNPMRRMGPIRHLVTVAGKRAHHELANGNPEKAVEDLLLANQIALSINQADVPIHYAVMAGSLMSRANREIRDAAWHPKMTADGIRRLLADLPKSEQLQKDFVRSLRSDLYWFIRNEVQRLKGPGGNSVSGRDEKEVLRDFDSGWQQADEVAHSILDGHENPFDRKATVLAAQELYAEVIENTQRPWSEQSMIGSLIGDLVQDWPRSRLMGASGDSPEAKEELKRVKPTLLKSKNPYGRLALWYFVPVSQQSVLIPFRNRADLEATRISLLVRLYEIEAGRLPSTLDELRAKGMIDTIPMDPFSDKPFGYDSARRKLWSVGQNGLNDGGKESPSLAASALDYVYALVPTRSINLPSASLVAAAGANGGAKKTPLRGPSKPKLEFLKGNAR